MHAVETDPQAREVVERQQRLPMPHSRWGLKFLRLLSRATMWVQHRDVPSIGKSIDLTFPGPAGDLNTFELITARHLVWTLPNPTAALQEWRRVVEPGGRILLIEAYWNHDEPWDEYEETYDDLPMYDGCPPEELSEVLIQEGLSEVMHEPLLDPVLWGREPHCDYYIMSGEVPPDTD